MATVNPAASTGSPYQVPPEPSSLPSIVMAVLMHALLLVFLWAGISWQNNAPVAVEAEVWDMKTQAAAPPPPPQVEPDPQPKPEPKPEPTPEPVRPPKAVEPPPAPKPPDIALERQKLKELKQKQLREQKLAEEKEREQEELKQKALEKKQLAEQKAKELDEQKAAEKADKLAKARKAAEEAKRMAKLREAEMRRITGAAGSAGGAPQATAPRIDSGYLASITSKIKSTTSYLGSTDVPGNPRAVFKIEELPTGEIISVKKMKSSGLPDFDDAVEKGIIKSSPLPKKKDGTVERTLEIGFAMKDLK